MGCPKAVVVIVQNVWTSRDAKSIASSRQSTMEAWISGCAGCGSYQEEVAGSASGISRAITAWCVCDSGGSSRCSLQVVGMLARVCWDEQMAKTDHVGDRIRYSRQKVDTHDRGGAEAGADTGAGTSAGADTRLSGHASGVAM